MLRVIDEGLDMTAKYDIGSEVVLTGYQGYRRGTVTGVSVQKNSKGTVFVYTVELYAGKHAAPKVKKCLEKYLFSNVRDALQALSEMAEKEESHEKSEA